MILKDERNLSLILTAGRTDLKIERTGLYQRALCKKKTYLKMKGHLVGSAHIASSLRETLI